MGGENGGDIASKMASDIITERLKAGYRSDMDANSIRNLLLTAIGAANTESKTTAGISRYGNNSGCNHFK